MANYSSVNALATPALYQIFIQTDTQALPLFLQRVANNPKLGLRIKRLVGFEYGEDERQSVFFEPLDLSNCQVLSKQLNCCLDFA